MNKEMTKQQEKSTLYKIEITKNLEDKIRFTCNKIHDVEWSGILFYTYTGTFEHSNLKIIAQDFLPMDIGNATFTSFDMNAEVINYMTENDLLDYKIGLIHSHNNMATFLSGTDIKTLEQEGNNTNNFVSLIVNNEGTYTAAITRKVKHNREIKDTYSYDFFDSGTITDTKEYTEEGSAIEWFYLKVIKPSENNYNNLNARLDEIKKQKIQIQQTQPSLFKTEPTVQKSWKQDSNYNYNSFYDYDYYDDFFDTESSITSKVEFDNKEVDLIVKQMLTGSILLTNANTINLKKWSNTMVGLYSKRFPDFIVFEDWVDTYVDFLLWNYKDKYITEEVEAEVFLAPLAKTLLSKISILKPNKYLDIFIKTLKKFVK